MRLLAVASTFPAREGDPVPAFIKDQMIALKKRQPELQISVLAPHDRRSYTNDFSRWPEYDEHRFHYFWPFSAEKLAGRGIMPALRANPLNYLLLPFLFLGEFRALLSLTRKLKPDVIYAHWFTPQGIVASWVAWITDTPFVFTTHASDVDVWRRIPLVGRQVVRRCARRARAFTSVSRRSHDKLKHFFSTDEWSVMQKRGAIIPMGVTLPSIDSKGSPKGRSCRTVILFLGRLVEKKGVQYLLQAYAMARPMIGDSLLVIAGDGPMREQLARQAENLGLVHHVRFAGFVTGKEKADLLGFADIHVTPSIIGRNGDSEGLPVSLMEGLAFGKICIATAESGADDYLTDGSDGFVVPEKDADALSAALIKANSLDDLQRREMQAAACQTAQQFDWTQVASRYHAFLLEPMARSRPPDDIARAC